jgi:hypothetical protein
MFQRSITFGLILLGVSVAGTALASAGEPVQECVDLTPERSLRHNGAQFLYVRDGEEHYRLSFRDGRCNVMTMTSKLDLVTGEAENRVCPEGSRVKARGQSCRVTGIERISEQDYARKLRRR